MASCSPKTGINPLFHPLYPAVVPDVLKGIRNCVYSPFFERLHVAVAQCLFPAKLSAMVMLELSFYILASVLTIPFTERLSIIGSGCPSEHPEQQGFIIFTCYGNGS
jgi:hypothetical protein